MFLCLVSDRRLALDIKQAHRPSDPVINTKSTTLPKITRDDLCVNDSSVKWEELRGMQNKGFG